MEYVAALDLGASKMLAAAAGMSDRSELLAWESVHPENAIRRGLIINRDRTAMKLTSLIGKINVKLQPKLKKIYVGIGGQSLHTKEIIIRKELHGQEVSPAVTNEIENECAAYADDSFAVFDYLLPEYYIDGRLELHHEGAKGERLEARCLLILGNLSLKNDVETIVDKANLEIAAIKIAPLATADALLTNKEKESGCALVEMGASLTYLSIYKNKVLRYLRTIPLGGHAITNDIVAVLNKTETEAEDLKKKGGRAGTEQDNEELDRIIEARAEEMVANVVEQIKQSGYESSVNTIVMTGGASQLSNLDQLLEQKSGKVVRRITDRPELSCILGLLKAGNKNCAKELPPAPPVSVEPSTPPVTDLFGDPVVQKPSHKGNTKEQKSKSPKQGEGLFRKMIQKGTTFLFNESETNVENNS